LPYFVTRSDGQVDTQGIDEEDVRLLASWQEECKDCDERIYIVMYLIHSCESVFI